MRLLLSREASVYFFSFAGSPAVPRRVRMASPSAPAWVGRLVPGGSVYLTGASGSTDARTKHCCGLPASTGHHRCCPGRLAQARPNFPALGKERVAFLQRGGQHLQPRSDDEGAAGYQAFLNEPAEDPLDSSDLVRAVPLKTTIAPLSEAVRL